jgi:hypothetical protein
VAFAVLLYLHLRDEMLELSDRESTEETAAFDLFDDLSQLITLPHLHILVTELIVQRE